MKQYIKICTMILWLACFLASCGSADKPQDKQVEETFKMDVPKTESEVPIVIAQIVEPESANLDSSIELDTDDSYMLAKIAMAEAEGEDTEGKALVIRVVLNRVASDCFPDNIPDVILQPRQFSPIDNGRYDRVEPNDDCYAALDLVLSGWDESEGALYFESSSDSTWHQKNLKYLFQHGNHYFYTEKEGD